MNQNMGKLMQQAQKMQEQMKKMQQAQKNLEVEGQSGAGLVKVVMTGKHDVKRVELDPSLMSEDKEMLEDELHGLVERPLGSMAKLPCHMQQSRNLFMLIEFKLMIESLRCVSNWNVEAMMT